MMLWTAMSELDDRDWGSPSQVTQAELSISDGEEGTTTSIRYGRAGFSGKTTESGSEQAHTRAQAIEDLMRGLQTTARRCYPSFYPGSEAE